MELEHGAEDDAEHALDEIVGQQQLDAGARLRSQEGRQGKGELALDSSSATMMMMVAQGVDGVGVGQEGQRDTGERPDIGVEGH